MPQCKRCGSLVSRASSCKVCHRLDRMETTRGSRRCDECGTAIPLWEEWCKECWERFRSEHDVGFWPPWTWAKENWSTAPSFDTSWQLSMSPAPTWTSPHAYSGEWSSEWGWHRLTWQPKDDQNKSQWNSTSAYEGERSADQRHWPSLSSPEERSDADSGSG